MCSIYNTHDVKTTIVFIDKLLNKDVTYIYKRIQY